MLIVTLIILLYIDICTYYMYRAQDNLRTGVFFAIKFVKKYTNLNVQIHMHYVKYELITKSGLVGVCSLMPLSTIFQLHRGGQFHPHKTTCRKSLTNFIT